MIHANRKRCALVLAAALCGPAAANAGGFTDPPVLASSGGLLDVLMIAAPRPAQGISFTPPGESSSLHPTGWVYEICPRAAATAANQCPPTSATASDYGGVRLALQKGDTLRIRLVNRLPGLDPVVLGDRLYPAGANLPLNPTNLDIRDLDTPPRAPTLAEPTFGNNVWIEIYNSANGVPQRSAMGMHEMTDTAAMGKNYADYRFDIPADHASGVFMFHPFLPELTYNQLASGLSGIVSIGQAADYARTGSDRAGFPEENVRHLVLKDMQVLAAGKVKFAGGVASAANGDVLSQQDPAFCDKAPGAGEIRAGACAGADHSASGGASYAGGRWYFTVSGQHYPTLTLNEAGGEIWRLINASGGATYDLQLVDGATKAPMPIQLVSAEGAKLAIAPETAVGAEVVQGGVRFRIAACPPAAAKGAGPAAVCVSSLSIGAGSRAEAWVAYRDGDGRLSAPPPGGATAILRTLGAGADGASAPEVDLAAVEFAPGGMADAPLIIDGGALAAEARRNVGLAFP